VVRGGVEPPTFRFSGAIWPSRTVAGRRLISHLPAPIVAGRRPASVTACLRWLPIWLPGVGDPAVIGLHISGFADRSLNSRTPAAAVSCAGPSRPPARSSPRPAEAPAADRRWGQGRIGRAVPYRTQGTDEDGARNIRRYARQRPNDNVTGTPRRVGRSARAHPGNRARASAASLSAGRVPLKDERSELALDGFRETSVNVRRRFGERACPRTTQVPSSRSSRWPAAALLRCSSPWWPRISARDRPLLPDASVFRRLDVARRPRPETPFRPRGSGTS